MIDINFIKNNTEAVEVSMRNRGVHFDLQALMAIDENRRKYMTEMQSLQAKKNEIADKVGVLKRTKGDEATIAKLMEDGDAVGQAIKEIEESVETSSQLMKEILEIMPNILDKSVPIGKDEDSNTLHHVFGEKPVFDFKPKLHFEIFDENLMDFENAVKISGSRFVILKGHLAMLERALKNFMLDIHTTEFGYTEMSVPYLVNRESAYGVGHLPNFEDDMFITTNDFCLISTAEVSLTNIVRDEILKEDDLPIRMTAFSSCFRSEAGSAGRDTRGMIRQHQFQKVELVSVVLPEESQAEHERMLGAAEEILRRLDLHYRVMTLCSGDVGFCSQKTYDIEVWLPGENKYREISSCSNMGNFQARRMSARLKRNDGKKELLHTLNGSGLAIGRTIVAILENYQQKDGSVLIPNALLPYTNGVTQIG